MSVCTYCGKGEPEKELRPYGPGGSWVCFACATETPEREAQTEATFGVLLDGAGAMTPVVAIGTSAGPQPATSVEDLDRLAGEQP